jgi:hypothetical protein
LDGSALDAVSKVDFSVSGRDISLETLILSGQIVTLPFVCTLPHWENLQALTLKDITVEDQVRPRLLSVEITSALAQCRTLRELWLNGFLGVEDGALECLAVGSPSIRAIRIDVITCSHYRARYGKNQLVSEMQSNEQCDRAVCAAFSSWWKICKLPSTTVDGRDELLSRLLIRTEVTFKTGMRHIHSEPRRSIWGV